MADSLLIVYTHEYNFDLCCSFAGAAILLDIYDQ